MEFEDEKQFLRLCQLVFIFESMNFEISKRENSVILLEKDYKQRYSYDPNSPESVIALSLLQEENLDQSLQLASLIQNTLVSELKRNNRHVKMDNFQVLREC